jgi:hypothetical protein
MIIPVYINLHKLESTQVINFLFTFIILLIKLLKFMKMDKISLLNQNQKYPFHGLIL